MISLLFRPGFFTVLLLIVSFRLVAQEITEKDCQCTSENKKIKSTSLKKLPGKRFLQELYDWKPVAKKGIKSWSFANLQDSISTAYSYHYFTAVASEPIRLMHPDQTYTINLTPCANPQKNYQLPVIITARNEIRNELVNFDYRAFDRTTRGYYEVLKAALKAEISNLLFQAITMDSDIPGSVSRINQVYHTAIPVDEEDTGLLVEMILQQLEEKRINPDDVIINQFLLEGRPNRIITDEDKDQLETIFNQSPSDLEMIDRYIYPEITIDFETTTVGVEISEKVIRKWDPVNQQPGKDASGKDMPMVFFSHLAYIRYVSESGLTGSLEWYCFPSMEITGTGILLGLGGVNLVDWSKNEYAEPGYETFYPLFLKPELKANHELTTNDDYREVYDTLLTCFSGLLAEGSMMLPFNNATMEVPVYSLMVNNKFIAGTLVLSEVALSDEETETFSENTLLTIDGNEMTLAQLKVHMTKLGIQETAFKVVEDRQVKMDFRIVHTE